MANGQLPPIMLERLVAATESLPDDITSAVETAMRYILRSDGDQDETPADETSALVVCCFVEAAKMDLSPDEMMGQLRATNLKDHHCNTLINYYKQHKPELRAAVSRIGWHPPHVLSVDWKLAYRVKGNAQGLISKPNYLVSFKLQDCDSPVPRDLVISCTVEHLQDMVWKLKEATRTVQRAANQDLSTR